ncbi:MAG: hypothetical protein GY714_05330 [Desulfobacterales bacterium]|nr:hypothetical protein [Desulfobacterales bacterium]
MNFKRLLFFPVLMLMLISSVTSYANEAKPVSADKAFDAVALQIDPVTKKNAKVAIVDLRTSAEYYWVGACAQVEMIVTKDGKEISPYLGKTIFDMKTSSISYTVMDGKEKKAETLPVSKIKTMFKNPVSINIPYQKWDESTQSKVDNTIFKKEIESLASKYDTLILMCRSGKRSSKCEFDFSLFKAVYEIDQPSGKNGKGGFQGTSYKEVYNGYRGYPGRNTDNQKMKSVSWNDFGLPVHIGWKGTKS